MIESFWKVVYYIKKILFPNNQSKLFRFLKNTFYNLKTSLIRLLGDPSMRVTLRGVTLELPFSHQLPAYIFAHTTYDSFLPRFCSFMIKKKIPVKVIDVGANIGDTALFIKKAVPTAEIFCFEPDRKYFDYLQRNTKNLHGIHAYAVALSDTVSTKMSQIVSFGGTARIISSNDTSMQFTSLDTVYADSKKEMQGMALLKIDTDGFEYNVLNGAKRFLTQEHPVLYFEYTPSALEENGSSGQKLFSLLRKKGYVAGVAYDHVGNCIAQFSNTPSSISLIDKKIDGNTICYYDILLLTKKQHHTYAEFIASELASRS